MRGRWWRTTSTHMVRDQFTEEHLAFLRRARERAPHDHALDGAGTPWLLLLLALMDAAGLMVAVLQTPARAATLGAGAATVGALVAAFFAAQTASAPLWGWLSDRVGRRPVLLGGLAASLLGHLLLAAADSLWLLGASRLLHGLGMGTAGVLLAAVTDCSAARARNLGRVGAAASVGGVLGPLLVVAAGGVPDGLPGLAPEQLMAAATMGVLLVAWRRLPRGAPAPLGATMAPRTASPRARADAAFLLVVYALAAGAASGAPAMLPLLLDGAAWHLIYLGGVGAVLRYAAVGPLASRLGETRLLALGLACIGAAVALLGAARQPAVALAALTALALGAAFAFPALGALLTAGVPAARRGTLLGVQQTAGGVARSLFPLALGLSLDRASVVVPCAVAGGVLLLLAVRVRTTVSMGSSALGTDGGSVRARSTDALVSSM